MDRVVKEDTEVVWQDRLVGRPHRLSLAGLEEGVSTVNREVGAGGPC